MSKDRIWELDFLRGLSIILMVFDHLMFDLASLPLWFSNFYQVSNPLGNKLRQLGLLYWNSSIRENFHFVFVAVFLLVSGISYTFSRSNLKRGLKFSIVALLISAITLSVQYFTGIEIGIVFGIIHMFAIGTLLTVLFRKIWNNNFFILAVGIVFIVYGLSFDFINVPYYSTLNFSRFLEVVIGLKGYGADHFGIFPYTGVIMIGTVIGNFFYAPKLSLLPRLDKGWNKPFTFAGKYTLIIFVTHQLILISLVFALGYIIGYKV
jgi:uncharacterized membrane protein